MKRLTSWSMSFTKDGNIEQHAIKKKTSREETIRCLDKLAYYEDLGYSPDELNDIICKYNKLKRLVKDIDEIAHDMQGVINGH